MKKIVAIFLTFLLILQSIPLTNSASASTYGTMTGEIKTEVSPNVTHIKRGYKSSSSVQSINILDVNLLNDYTNIEIGLPNSLNRLTRTSVLAQNNSYEGHRVVGAVNASFFNSSTREPSSLLAVNNEIRNYGVLGTNTESPTQKAVAFGVSKDGKGIADYFTTNMSYEINGIKYTLNYIDEPRSSGSAVLYTSSNSTTGTNEWGMEIVVENANVNTKKIRFGEQITGIVKAITPYQKQGNNAVPENGFVISVAGQENANALSHVKIGDQVKVNVEIDDKWKDAQFILAAGPLLVKDGKQHISMPTSTSFVKGINPRTAVAVDATGTRIFLVTVDGRISGHSTGTSLTNLANYLISLGATSAINLDGGGSTTMAVRQLGTNTPVVVNKPSDGSERAISTILQVVNSAGAGMTRAITLNDQVTNMEVGQTYKMAVKSAYDEYFNPKNVKAEQMTWKVEGGIGTFNGAIFTPTKGGKGKIIGTFENSKVEWNVTVVNPFEKPIIVSAFDSLDAYKATSERGVASIKTNKTTARKGSSIEVTYDFTAGEKGTKTANVILNQPATVRGIPDHLGMWVYGDGNKNWLRTKIIDGSGKTHTLDFTNQSKMDWVGWKYVTVKIPTNIATPIKVERVYMASPVESEWSKGKVYFDQLQAVYDANYVEPIYTDIVTSNWAYDSIKKLNDLNLVKGYMDGTYKPNQNITRAEAASILARYLNKKVTESTEFTDVSPKHFAYESIQMMAQEGIIAGKGDKKFAPDEQLTRAEMSVIITKMFGITEKAKLVFTDLNENHWAYSYIQAVVAKGYASGYPDNTFRPNNPITRAEFASLAGRAIK